MTLDAPPTGDPFTQLGELPARVNMADLLPRRAEAQPEADALVCQAGGPYDRWPRTRYAELAARVNRIARGLREQGVRPGDRVCLFVRPGIELIALTYALFRLGAVPVLADPGMGRRRLLEVVRRMRPRVFIGIPLAHAVRLAFASAFASVELAITVGRRLFWGGVTLEALERESDAPLDQPPTEAADTAAILFTSGSTGPPKGVVYTHGMFEAQVRALGALYDFQPGEVDLACFPLFALFDVAFGMTTVIPDLDASRPGRCDPRRIVCALQASRATTSFGSPAIWRRVVPHCLREGIELPDLKRVLIAGAPVPPRLIADFHRVLPADGDVFTPYGATESLPVSSIAGREIVSLVERTRAGEGSCVGRTAPGIDLRLVAIADEPHASFADAGPIEAGAWGEVCVRGPVVTREYAEDERATGLAKMRPEANESGIWHRMGDVGRFDDEGRLWLGGRKAHRLRTEAGLRMPVPTENVFNECEGVHRTALVGCGVAGAERPVLVVECEAGRKPAGETARARLAASLDAIGARLPESLRVEHYLLHDGFPVDVRHNAKIHREELKVWAEEQLAKGAGVAAGRSGATR